MKKSLCYFHQCASIREGRYLCSLRCVCVGGGVELTVCLAVGKGDARPGRRCCRRMLLDPSAQHRAPWCLRVHIRALLVNPPVAAAV